MGRYPFYYGTKGSPLVEPLKYMGRYPFYYGTKGSPLVEPLKARTL